VSVSYEKQCIPVELTDASQLKGMKQEINKMLAADKHGSFCYLLPFVLFSCTLMMQAVPSKA
jgi:hypothetical protein